MFSINQRNNSGFRVAFDNGFIASVQWGSGTYSSNRGSDYDKTPVESQTAEVAIMDAEGKFYDRDGRVAGLADQVIGYMTPEEVASFIYNVSQLRREHAEETEENVEDGGA
jgi:hypothetical protein